MLFYPPASRPDTAHRVLGHDAARCRNIAAILVRHRTGDRARLFQPVDHDVDRLVPWGKIMPAGGAFGEKGLESLKVAFLQGIECSMRDRKSVVSGKSVSVRVDLGGRRIIKKKKKKT